MSDTATNVPVRPQRGSSRGRAPQRSSEWRPLETLHQEVDRIFADFDRLIARGAHNRPQFNLSSLWRPLLGRSPEMMAPAMDLIERDQGYELSVELPGMEPGDIELKASHDMLTIRGEKKDACEGSDATSFMSERCYGSFERSLRLPDGVEPERISASYKHGVLTVRIPKSPESVESQRHIDIQNE